MHLPDAEVHAALEYLYRSGRFSGVFGVGLSLTVPDDACTPGSVTEVVATSYNRVALASTSSGWAAAATRAIETIVSTTFPAPTDDWGTVLSIPLYDTTVKATGNLLGAIRLSTGVNVLAGGSAVFIPAGVIRYSAP